MKQQFSYFLRDIPRSIGGRKYRWILEVFTIIEDYSRVVKNFADNHLILVGITAKTLAENNAE